MITVSASLVKLADWRQLMRDEESLAKIGEGVKKNFKVKKAKFVV
jgi:hypothetical protein